MLLSVENTIYAEQVGLEVMLYICIWDILDLNRGHYATSRKIMGLRSDEVIEFFQFT
jgi:hypothetical protein